MGRFFLLTIGLILAGCGNKSEPGPETKTGKTTPNSQTSNKPMLNIQPDPLSVKLNGLDVTRYILSNKNGMTVSLIDWGATVTSVRVPDKDGNLGEVILSYESIATYATNPSYFGCTVGRYANRIANGEFTIGDKKFPLTTNDGPTVDGKKKHLLHGGAEGFNRRLWLAEKVKADDSVGIRFTLHSKDGDQGFPGNVTVHVTYILTNDNELKIEYEATTDKPTHVNLTNHIYWNLAGPGGTALEHELMLNCDRYLPVDADLIPTGEKRSVKDSPWDFTTLRTLGERIDDERLGKKEEQSRGYDHCYIIRSGITETNSDVPLAARVHDPKSGRVMEIYTDQPGIQLYSGNFLDGSINSGGFPRNGALCLECQKFPDTPHHVKEGFPTTLITPETPYLQLTVHKFTVKK